MVTLSPQDFTNPANKTYRISNPEYPFLFLNALNRTSLNRRGKMEHSFTPAMIIGLNLAKYCLPLMSNFSFLLSYVRTNYFSICPFHDVCGSKCHCSISGKSLIEQLFRLELLEIILSLSSSSLPL